MFSTTVSHALRALVHLAALPAGTSVLGRRLAEAENVPASYLSKILLALRNAGLLATTRGSGGGYRLRRGAGEIRLLEVVELFEPARALPECLMGRGRSCSDDKPCSAHAAWRQVKEAYVGFLESTTIADIARHDGSPGTPGAAATEAMTHNP